MASKNNMLEILPCQTRRSEHFRIVAGLLFFALAAGFGACKSDYQGAARQTRAGDNKAARQVKTARVEQTPFGETVSANGTLAAFDQSTAGVKVAGRLSTISVDLGSIVRRGQVIAMIEPNDYKLRVQQAEAALSQARARLGLSPKALTTKSVRSKQALYVRRRLNSMRLVLTASVQ
jgi:multidrug efflux pump subunit AcrA (membrane-fusion protein)